MSTLTPSGATGGGGGTSMPAGALAMFAGSSVPTGWLNCDGSAVSRTTYAALFSAIGTTWGAGDGSTTFNLPDLRSRSPIGVGQGSGLSNRTLAGTGGAETHTLSTGEIPAHTHTNQPNPNAGGGAIRHLYATDGIGTNYWTTSSTGGGGSHNNMHPFAGVYFIIKT